MNEEMEVDNYGNYDFDSDEEHLVGITQSLQYQQTENEKPENPASSSSNAEPKKANSLNQNSILEDIPKQPRSEINLRNFNRPRICSLDSREYQVLSQQDIYESMRLIIEEVSGIIEVPAVTTQLLLVYLKWDKDRLVERYYEDSERLFRDAHVIDPSADICLDFPAENCEICFSEIDSKNSKQAECGHTFCSFCWLEYFQTKILSESLAGQIPCPAHKCGIFLNANFILEFFKEVTCYETKCQSHVTESRVQAKLKLDLVNNFIRAEKNIRFCPGFDCQAAIRLVSSASEWTSVTCSFCNKSFCFLCGEAWHDPVLCQLLKKWLKKNRDDCETSNWILSNTKECPKCSVAIEKNEGCNQMTCIDKNGCGAAFCWICLKIGNAYQPHGCNVFVEKADASSQRASLERYLFFETRFTIHQQSLKLETKLLDSVQKRMDEMIACDMSWMDVQFLKASVETLRRCRQTLMYTYAFSFFLEKNSQQEIFEQNQADLQLATEKLSGYLDHKINLDKDVNEMKRTVLDSMAYCTKRREILVQHVYEGYEAESWVFTV